MNSASGFSAPLVSEQLRIRSETISTGIDPNPDPDRAGSIQWLENCVEIHLIVNHVNNDI